MLKIQEKNESSSDEQLQKTNSDCETSCACNSDSPLDNLNDYLKSKDENNASSEAISENTLEKTPKNLKLLFPPIPTEYRVSLQEILS